MSATGVFDELKLRFNSSKTPAGSNLVNTTRYCKYGQVLLMMGENIARNM